MLLLVYKHDHQHLNKIFLNLLEGENISLKELKKKNNSSKKEKVVEK
jgi:hypothetical protein